MRTSASRGWIILGLLGVTVMLWTLLLLSQLHAINVFDAYLLKMAGPVVVFGAMLLCPLLAAMLGLDMVRRRQSPLVGHVASVGGGLLAAAFVILIGVPLLIHARTPATPKNPSTPRPVVPPTGLSVFPGAEGFGTRTPAGRGGKVMEVTSLADDGPGTLRAALQDPSPRIIVFRVGGTIELRGELAIAQPFVTVAGQTASGGGICIKNAGIGISTHDVLIQHLRVRPGNEGGVDSENNDAISILGKHGNVGGAYNVVLDHISASWGEDETISTWYGAHDVTISWCIVSEALNRSRHRKGTHSAGLLIGDSSEHVSVHHCLLAHNDFRNPLISNGGTHDIVNNVIYDWGAISAEVYDTDSNSFLNFVGNFFRPGPSTNPGPCEITINPTREPGIPKLYVEGNLGPHRSTAEMDEWALVCRGWGRAGVAPQIYRAKQPFAVPAVKTSPAADAFHEVLAGAGASLPQRDAVDRRVVAEAQNTTGKIIDSPAEVGGYPQLARGTPPADSDHDGMPDAWEVAHGLDPHDAGDGSAVAANGYTHVENHLNELAGDPIPGPGQDVDSARTSAVSKRETSQRSRSP